MSQALGERLGAPEERARRLRRRRVLRAGLGALVVLLVAGLAISWWARPRGPRWLERWPAAGGGFSAWEEVSPGVEYARARWDVPRPLKCHVLRIDLSRSDLEVVAVALPEAVNVFKSDWVTSFVRKEGLLAAINATPFEPEPWFPGGLVRPAGVVVAQRWPIGDAASNLDALCQTTNGVWSVVKGQNNLPEGLRLAVGGFLVNLRDGQNLGEHKPEDAATVVGLSADRRWMYWLVVDGGQPGYSEGLTPRESAEILKNLGASDAINMDGGGSTTMALARGWAGVQLVNRPRSPGISGLQRPVACVLGVRRR